jgi:hypothetical protein
MLLLLLPCLCLLPAAEDEQIVVSLSCRKDVKSQSSLHVLAAWCIPHN